jgi:hypothetical protein
LYLHISPLPRQWWRCGSNCVEGKKQREPNLHIVGVLIGLIVYLRLQLHIGSVRALARTWICPSQMQNLRKTLSAVSHASPNPSSHPTLSVQSQGLNLHSDTCKMRDFRDVSVDFLQQKGALVRLEASPDPGPGAAEKLIASFLIKFTIFRYPWWLYQ